MFNFFKKTFSSIYQTITLGLSKLFGASRVDKETLDQLSALLIRADTGSKTVKGIMAELENKVNHQAIKTGVDLRNALEQQLISILDHPIKTIDAPVILLVGVNGCGKTTFASKLAHLASNNNQRVTFAAADTFRAAAPEQLEVWAKKTNSILIKGNDAQDPASVVYMAAQELKKGSCDKLIIDTAGRLQTKNHLMAELSKIKRVLQKTIGDTPVHTMLTIDGMLGQNSMHQARQFHEATDLDSIVLTKMDGTGKGGIVFAIAQELGLGISYISHGESPEALLRFDPQTYVQNLLNS